MRVSGEREEGLELGRQSRQAMPRRHVARNARYHIGASGRDTERQEGIV